MTDRSHDMPTGKLEVSTHGGFPAIKYQDSQTKLFFPLSIADAKWLAAELLKLVGRLEGKPTRHNQPPEPPTAAATAVRYPATIDS